VICNFGVSSLIPGQGFNDVYDNIRDSRGPLMAAFVDLILTY
jgi:hypothetical protein